MTKCNKCNGTGSVGSVYRDRFNQPIETGDMLVAFEYSIDRDDEGVTVNYNPILLVIMRTEIDMRTNCWTMRCRNYYSHTEYVFYGHGDEPCASIICLNKSTGDMQKDGGI